jgi:hypothetical protein
MQGSGQRSERLTGRMALNPLHQAGSSLSDKHMIVGSQPVQSCFRVFFLD